MSATLVFKPRRLAYWAAFLREEDFESWKMPDFSEWEFDEGKFVWRRRNQDGR